MLVVLSAVGNAVISAAYLAISLAVLRPLLRTQQVPSNRLGTATAAIFFSCSVGHGLHTAHALLPALGAGAHPAPQIALHDLVWTLATAAVGLYYWTMRSTYGELMRGAALFDDLLERQQRTELEAAQALAEARQEAEDARAAQDAMLRAIVDNSDALIHVKDLEGRYLLVNQAVVDLLGRSEQELLGTTNAARVDAETAARHRANDRLAEAGPVQVEEHALVDGRLRTYDSRKFPLRDAHGRTYAVAGVAVDVTLRTQVAEELDRARRAAEEASAHKSAFLAAMSHEIRTPLNGVLGLTRLLLESDLDPQQRTWATSAQRSGEVLLAVVNDALDLSKVEAGRMQLERRPFDLRTLLDDVLEPHAEQAAAAGLRLTAALADGTPPYRTGDPVRVRQVLQNLVSNALTHTERGGVSVHVRGDAEHVVLQVRDTGVGMTPDQVGRLFRPFEQVGADTARRYSGTGLGLAIVRGLTEAMGGAVDVASTPGEGSVFRVDLPLPVASAPPPRRPEEQAAPRAGRVLVVDDNAVNQLVARAELELRGLQVDTVGDGQQALDALDAASYDLVLMDRQMPVLDGLAATRLLRARGCRTPVVAMTASAFEEDRAACLAAGMDGFLPKPWSPEEIEAALEAALSPARASLPGRPEQHPQEQGGGPAGVVA